jgi:hypothetical protein
MVVHSIKEAKDEVRRVIRKRNNVREPNSVFDIKTEENIYIYDRRFSNLINELWLDNYKLICLGGKGYEYKYEDFSDNISFIEMNNKPNKSKRIINKEDNKKYNNCNINNFTELCKYLDRNFTSTEFLQFLNLISGEKRGFYNSDKYVTIPLLKEMNIPYKVQGDDLIASMNENRLKDVNLNNEKELGKFLGYPKSSVEYFVNNDDILYKGYEKVARMEQLTPKERIIIFTLSPYIVPPEEKAIYKSLCRNKRKKENLEKLSKYFNPISHKLTKAYYHSFNLRNIKRWYINKQ